MALKLRQRKSDPQVVKDLFALHKILNDRGRHWIQGSFEEATGAQITRCLVGGARATFTGHGYSQPNPMYTREVADRYDDLLVALNKSLPKHHRIPLHRYSFGGSRIDVPALESACVNFNDATMTTWAKVEDVIRKTIVRERVK